MSGLSIALLVLFVIVCVLIVLLVLLQNEEGDSLGGLFAGGSNSAFGSRSANILTKITYVAVGLFFVTAFLLAFMNRGTVTDSLSDEAKLKENETKTEWWKNEDGDKKDAEDADSNSSDEASDSDSDNDGE